MFQVAVYLVTLATLLMTSSVHGDDQLREEPNQKACAEGFAWHVPPKKKGEDYNEQYLILGSGNKLYRICHCSSDAPPGFYVQLNAVLPGTTPQDGGSGLRTVTTRFQKMTCLYTDSTLVWVENTDANIEASGSIENPK